MNEDAFNLEIRRFLKRFGVTAQREIEKAIEAGIKSGGLKGQEVLPVRATLTIPGLLPGITIDGEIALAGQDPASP